MSGSYPSLGKTLLGVRMTGIGASVPATVLTNDDMARLVETSDEWISSRTGIRERRVLSANETLTDLAIAAAKDALASAGQDGSDLDLIVVATSTPDERYPATAARVQQAIGATHATGFDLALACTGFVSAVITVEQLLRTGLYRKALVVGADAHSRVMDWTDRNTCVLFGDAAGAAILEASETTDDFLGADSHLDGSKADELYAHNSLVNCPLVQQPEPRSPYVQMNGREVFKFAVGTVPKSILAVLEQAGLTLENLDYLVLHQANIRIMQAMSEKLNLPESKILVNLQKYGNTSAASVPLALNEAVLNGQIQPGQTLLLCGFGGGLSWSSSLLRWSHQDARLKASSPVNSPVVLGQYGLLPE